MNYYAQTDIGVYRNENQDASIVIQTKKLVFAAVCDGMGGHKGGNEASQLTITAFKKMTKKWLPKNAQEARKWIEESFNLAKKLMKRHAKENYELLDMGTTVTCVFIAENGAWIFNVGDSRVYAFTDILHKITEDHNLMNYYIKFQGMDKEKARKLRSASALTSALGPTKDIRVSPYEIEKEVLKTIKYFILTSDGVHDYIGNPLFELVLTSSKTSLKEKTTKLIHEAIQGGSKDNLSIIILENT